jgi:hypothetical protein
MDTLKLSYDVRHHTGWWFHPLWEILVIWDHYSQYGKIKHVPNHQAAYMN